MPESILDDFGARRELRRRVLRDEDRAELLHDAGPDARDVEQEATGRDRAQRVDSGSWGRLDPRHHAIGDATWQRGFRTGEEDDTVVDAVGGARGVDGIHHGIRSGLIGEVGSDEGAEVAELPAATDGGVPDAKEGGFLCGTAISTGREADRREEGDRIADSHEPGSTTRHRDSSVRGVRELVAGLQTGFPRRCGMEAEVKAPRDRRGQEATDVSDTGDGGIQEDVILDVIFVLVAL